jgi:hypoxanthine phosphoribosyltransferase
MEKVYYSWDKITNMTLDLYEDLKPVVCDTRMIVAVQRGGLVLGTMLSHLTGKPLKVIDPSEPTPDWFNAKLYDILLVDEISDSGSTFEKLTHTCPGATTVALHARKSTKFEPDYVAEWIDHDGWLVYPWEVDS